MRLSYKLSKLAQNDLSGIWNYTFDKWSSAQADKYYKQPIKGVVTICAAPKIGKSVSEIKETHRVFRVKSHLIVYEIDHDLIIIDRILHERLDIDGQFYV